MKPRKARKRKYKEMEEKLEEKKNLKYDFFNKFKQLDSNVIGIIFSCIADDLNFLLYLRENNIRPYYNPIKWNQIDFYHVSRAIERLDDIFILEFAEQLDWHVVTDIQIKKQKFLETYDNFIDFDVVSNKMKFDDTLDYNFFLKYKEKLDWTKIARWDYIAEDFIDIFHIELDWEVLSKQQGLTRYLLEKYIDKLVLDQLQTNINIKDELKREIIARREDLELDRDLERELENVDDDVNMDDDLPLLFEEDNQILPADFHPELPQPNNYHPLPLVLVDEDEDSDLDINDEYDSDDFFPEPIDNIPDEIYTIAPPHIQNTDEDIDMNPIIQPTDINITTDIIIDIIDEDRLIIDEDRIVNI